MKNVWLQRHYGFVKRYTPEATIEANATAAELRQDYLHENFGPYSDYEWGMLCGKLSALRWVLGCAWDLLST